jgi:hypothetical protein
LEDFDDWLSSLPCTEKVVIAGNHDTALKHCGSVIKSATWLQDESILLPRCGLRIYGNGWSHRGHSHNVAYQSVSPSVDADAVKAADVVLTHHCTEQICDLVLRHARPQIWASGHAHGAHGAYLKDGTWFVNASIMDSRYCPLNPPVVIDMPRKKLS